MSAPQFFVERLTEGDRAALSPADSRHALRSLRLRPGEGLALADGDGALAAGRLVGQEDGVAVVEVGEVRRVVRRAPILSIAMAAPKGDRLAWAVQKLAELGADDLLLIESERSIRRWDGGRRETALARLASVAREAAMQSRRPFVMNVAGPWPLAEAVAATGAQAVLLWEGGGEPLGGLLRPDASGIRLVVGPEGGFEEREIEAARTAGAEVASLGEAVLRTETAALAAATVALHRLGRLG
jgi:16S rRNA (uracil1498-N3)-methyltransferase